MVLKQLSTSFNQLGRLHAWGQPVVSKSSTTASMIQRTQCRGRLCWGLPQRCKTLRLRASPMWYDQWISRYIFTTYMIYSTGWPQTKCNSGVIYSIYLYLYYIYIYMYIYYIYIVISWFQIIYYMISWNLSAHRHGTEEFWKQIELPNGADEIYVCIGVKASNYFMPAETLSDKGPGRLGKVEWVEPCMVWYSNMFKQEWRFEG